jgi:hypothetical protein
MFSMGPGDGFVEKPGFSLPEQANRCFWSFPGHEKTSYQSKTWFLKMEGFNEQHG